MRSLDRSSNKLSSYEDPGVLSLAGGYTGRPLTVGKRSFGALACPDAPAVTLTLEDGFLPMAEDQFPCSPLRYRVQGYALVPYILHLPPLPVLA